VEAVAARPVGSSLCLNENGIKNGIKGRPSKKGQFLMTLIIIIVLILLLGGGGGYYGHSRWGYGGGAGIGLGTVLLILLIAYLLGAF
jgi:hypothetical protein